MIGFTNRLQEARADAIESRLDDLMLGDGDELAGALVKYLGHSDVAQILASILIRDPNGSDANDVCRRLAEKMMAEPYDMGHDED